MIIRVNLLLKGISTIGYPQVTDIIPSIRLETNCFMFEYMRVYGDEITTTYVYLKILRYNESNKNLCC